MVCLEWTGSSEPVPGPLDVITARQAVSGLSGPSRHRAGLRTNRRPSPLDVKPP